MKESPWQPPGWFGGAAGCAPPSMGPSTSLWTPPLAVGRSSGAEEPLQDAVLEACAAPWLQPRSHDLSHPEHRPSAPGWESGQAGNGLPKAQPEPDGMEAGSWGRIPCEGGTGVVVPHWGHHVSHGAPV